MSSVSTSPIRTYTVILEPIPSGWRAYCLKIPECSGEGSSQTKAYKAVKENIRQYLRRCLDRKQTPRIDQTKVKFFRVDLRDFEEDEDLR